MYGFYPLENVCLVPLIYGVSQAHSYESYLLSVMSEGIKKTFVVLPGTSPLEIPKC